MERTSAFRYAVLGILSRAGHGFHGWAIKRQCEMVFGCVWEVNVGRVYRALDQLSAAGLIEPAETIDANDLARRRKVFRITAAGWQRLAGLFADAEDGTEWARRDEFAALLLFSECGGPSARARLIERERRRCQLRLRAVLRQRRKHELVEDGSLLHSLVDGAEMEVRARMAWLERVATKGEMSSDHRSDSVLTRGAMRHATSLGVMST